MIPRDVKSPTAPIPFHKLPKVVAIVDPDDEQTRGLLIISRRRTLKSR